MRASELPAIALRAGPIQLTDRHRLWGRPPGSLLAAGVDRRPPALDLLAPLPGARRLGGK